MKPTTIEFWKERETKNTVRYTEQGDPAVIGTLYVQKWFLKQIGVEGEGYPGKLVIEMRSK